MKIAYLTAGGAGMFCGSCMHDNTLARAMIRLGADVQLVPLYTPIRTDEEDVSVDRIFYGGVKLYLQQKFRLFRYLPLWMEGLLDRPALLKWAASRGVETSAAMLGDLTVSMLQGSAGHLRREVARLADWLQEIGPPDIIATSNMLIAGCVPALKERFEAPVIVTLQGDDVFLKDLAEPYQSQALDEIKRLAKHIDGYICNSTYYADYMAEYLGLDRQVIRTAPLGIDTSDFRHNRKRGPSWEGDAPTVGYLARLAPEKGLHLLVDAFIELRRRKGLENARLHIAGWLGPPHDAYAKEQFEKLERAGLADDFVYFGAIERKEKLDFLHSLDVLSVPTVYREPKGLFVLEALAAGVPVVQPNHGAFPELLADLGGGTLFTPGDPQALADALQTLLLDHDGRGQLSLAGCEAVHQRRNAQAMAESTLSLFMACLGKEVSSSPQVT